MGWFESLYSTPPVRGFKIGLEIEIEGTNLRHGFGCLNPDFWIIESDGSLRNGYEFKSLSALDYDKAMIAVDMYEQYLTQVQAKATARTSVHIHVNVQDLTPEQLQSFIWLSVAIEPVILRFCTALRNHNGYCVPTFKCINQAKTWRNLFSAMNKGRNALVKALTSFPKYAAIGGYRLRDLGTVEFRMFPGCTYAPKIKWYVDIIKSIYDQAMMYSVKELQDRKTSQGVLSLVADVILENRKRVTLTELSNLTEIGIRMANDIVRPALSLDQLKELHSKLFPSTFKPIDFQKLCELATDPDALLTELKSYDPEEVNALLQDDEYTVFLKLTSGGVPAAVAIKVTGLMKEVYNV